MTAKRKQSNKKLFSIKSLKTKGFTLTELLVGVAIFSILALVVFRISSQAEKSAKRYEVNADVTTTENEIGAILSDVNKCTLTFEGTMRLPVVGLVSALNQATVAVTTQDAAGNDINYNKTEYTEKARKFPQGTGDENIIGSSGVKLASINLVDPTADGTAAADYYQTQGELYIGEEILEITFKNKRLLLNPESGNEDIVRRINIYVERLVSDGTLVKCVSLAFNNQSIWKMGMAGDIYYDGGNVGINTDAPDAQLDVNGDIEADNIIARTFLYSSDSRLKKNVEEIDNPISKIQKLRGVTFDWKADGRHDYGFIAQEVGELLPEIVQTGGKQKTLTVDYGKVVPLLLEAIKKQNIQIQNLEKEIENIK